MCPRNDRMGWSNEVGNLTMERWIESLELMMRMADEVCNGQYDHDFLLKTRHVCKKKGKWQNSG